MLEDTKIEALRKYFRGRSDIAFAFLFGSQAKGKANKLSDVDIAVYFYPEKRQPIEYEREIFYPSENDTWLDLEKILKKEVELLVLNRVSASVAASAINGIILAINDWGIYLDFMETVTTEAIDFRNLVVKDFLAKYERRS